MDEALYGERLPAARPDLVVSCGDLPFDFLEYLVSRLDVPLLYVPGNHDPSLRSTDTTWSPLRHDVPRPGPAGCDNLDGNVEEAAGLRVAGLGGSVRYKPEGVHQYTQAQMAWRALKLDLRLRLRPAGNSRRLDVLVTHAPPFGLEPAQDAAHAGFVAFRRLVTAFRPRLLIHGHVHPYGRAVPERMLAGTRVVNAVPSRIIEL